MDTKELQQKIAACLANSTLTVRPETLGTQDATKLLHAWLPDGLVLGGAHLENTDTGVKATGQIKWPGAAPAATTAEFGIDNGAATLYVPIPLPLTWVFTASFPKIPKPNALDLLTYALDPPQLLLTSLPRAANDECPALRAGLNFHAPKVRLPAGAGALAVLAPLDEKDGTLPLTGLILPPAANGLPGIDLRSGKTAPGTDLHMSYWVWAGSRNLDTTTPDYDVQLRADVQIAKDLTVEVGGSLQPGPIVFQLTAPPADAVPTSGLNDWAGLGEAFTKAEKKGFPLGDKVQLSSLSITINTDILKTDGVTKALQTVQVDLDSTPKTTWSFAGGDIELTGVGASLIIDSPLQPSRNIRLIVRGHFKVGGSIALLVDGEIPPGILTVSENALTNAPLTEVVRHFLPQADLGGMPGITLTDFWAQITPSDGTFSVQALAIITDATLDLGAAAVTLTQAGFTLQYEKSGSGATTTADLSATAVVAPRGKPLTDGIRITADCAIPGAFRLTGSFDKKISLTDLIDRLAAGAGFTLPSGMPAVTLSNTKASVQGGPLWELGLSGEVTYDKYTLAVVGKAARPAGDPNATTTVLVVGLWQKDWVFSPRDIGAWKESLPILDDLTFTDSGLVVSTADKQPIDVASTHPQGLPATVGKGLTFFSTLGFTGSLAFLAKLFPGAKGITVTALLAAQIKNSEFTAVIAQGATLNGFGALTLTVRPATDEITLNTSFVLELPAIAGNGKLQLTGLGAVSKPPNGNLTFSLKLFLHAINTSRAPGTLLPGQLALTLDEPGHTLITADPEPEAAFLPVIAPLTGDPHTLDSLLRDLTSLGHTPLPVLHTDATDPTGPYSAAAAYALLMPAPPDPQAGALPSGPAYYFDSPPAWKNAFGIKNFDIESFFLEIGYASPALLLGGGGQLKIGSGADAVTLALAVEGTPDPPDIAVFAFALKPEDEKKGVSLHDIVALVLTPPEALDILKKIVIHKLAIRLVTVAGGKVIDNVLWPQGLYAAGDIDFFDNNWRFEINVTPTGVYAKSDIQKPLTVKKLLTLSDTGGTKGPQFLLDLTSITSGTIPSKVLALSGKVTVLDAASAALDASLGKDGFTFDVAVKVGGLSATLTCALDLTAGKLTATATATLTFTIDAPTGWNVPGTLLDVDATGTLKLTVTKDSATVDLPLKAKIGLAGDQLPEIDLNITGLGITSFNDVAKYFTDTPSRIWGELGNIAEDIGNCAVSTAENLL
ncbi:hypothetical protein [Streptomyces sp. CBMA156]|uniref:hypothetical protein n=1 Tax=Streptomyces sp. CBMA156 TaxID=1930280 RepID=UPI001661C836|nr:hypothetical protein [Streptomyces sp. CBMA156]MBD0673894.1 hypothetical protein [Streptomyces sp. CBMA156]